MKFRAIQTAAEMSAAEEIDEEMGSLTEGTFGGSLSDVKEEIMAQIKFLHEESPPRQPFERIASLCERFVPPPASSAGAVAIYK